MLHYNYTSTLKTAGPLLRGLLLPMKLTPIKIPGKNRRDQSKVAIARKHAVSSYPSSSHRQKRHFSCQLRQKGQANIVAFVTDAMHIG